ncbi:HAMP domain-containing protein [Rickettsiales endosymbiont of Peranema trichophorum]|uniref:sensor histidine kinase n=1 Tax=Rickettsiales endosymbiont of Peranema trichophorum TaxID=2486577 RepID=UPI0010EC3AA6|nr:ATP-binding protein [Rickettsiales endosymbiont of Peranema trichophorum]RZI47412.1 HAMP domain-containing protein [Rickettsiales endosymbiont of Peranema trichophorum]
MLKRFLRKLSDTTLKSKMVLLIGCLVTITPTVLVAILASVYYYLGIHSLFDEKISNIVAETVKVAELYLEEHKENIKTDALYIANSINKNYSVLIEEPEFFDIFLNKQAEFRNLAEAMVFTPRAVLAKTYLSFSLTFDRIAPEDFQKAEKGEIVILKSDQQDRVRALIKLDKFLNTYLLVGRYVDLDIIHHLNVTKGSASQYHQLLDDINFTKHKLEVFFLLSAILLSGISILVAIKLSNIISLPIQNLVSATAMIKEGDYSVRVPESSHTRDETAVLARAFNSMTKKIATQTTELMTAKDIIDERRRFIETVLGELSSGVLVINGDGVITLCNQSGVRLLQADQQQLLYRNYTDSFPEISHILDQAQNTPQGFTEDSIIIERNGRKTYLFIRIARELTPFGKIARYIITFDDISKLIAAERASAWSDIARRIAHEIKNPLTPIHLAAERMKRKFSKHIQFEQEAFTNYIETIIRHVEDIGNMVEEFVQFVRIPVPQLATHDIYKIINDVLFLQTNVYHNIQYEFEPQHEECYVICDRAQITRVIFNLVKNANEAITNLHSVDDTKCGIVKIRCNIIPTSKVAVIEVEDTGGGIPNELLDKVTEPYVTGKISGTGLGLSIVKKIIEEHSSELSIVNIVGGSIISFYLPLADTNTFLISQ